MELIYRIYWYLNFISPGTAQLRIPLLLNRCQVPLYRTQAKMITRVRVYFLDILSLQFSGISAQLHVCNTLFLIILSPLTEGQCNKRRHNCLMIISVKVSWRWRKFFTARGKHEDCSFLCNFQALLFTRLNEKNLENLWILVVRS